MPHFPLGCLGELQNSRFLILNCPCDQKLAFFGLFKFSVSEFFCGEGCIWLNSLQSRSLLCIFRLGLSASTLGLCKRVGKYCAHQGVLAVGVRCLQIVVPAGVVQLKEGGDLISLVLLVTDCHSEFEDVVPKCTHPLFRCKLGNLGHSWTRNPTMAMFMRRVLPQHRMVHRAAERSLRNCCGMSSMNSCQAMRSDRRSRTERR